MTNKPYTEEELNFIKELYFDEDYTAKDIAEEFNKKFNRNAAAKSIISIKYRHFKEVKKTSAHYRVPKKVRDYIKSVVSTKSYQEIQNDIKEKFNIDYSLDGIGDYARKHLGAVKKANKGQFQKGQYAGKLYKIGDEVERDNYVRIKVGQPMEWVQKQRYIYEQHFGKLKKGEFIIFLDGNTKNFDINNLYKVNRGILVNINKKNFANRGEFTRTAINYYELLQAMKHKGD